MLKKWNNKEILAWTTDFFKSKEIGNPRLNAELIISSVLKLNRLDLYLQFDRVLSFSERDKIKKLILKRAAGEPLQYVLGECDFYGFRILVNEKVLIPRPETELLVERIVKDNTQVASILEIGTGSGAIAVVLKKNFPEAEITATDISEKALAVAKQNSEYNETKITFLKSDIFSELSEKFEIIVSNPPYISAAEFENLPPEIKEFEPKNALFSAEDGLYFYRKILANAENHLLPNGSIYLEIGSEQADEILIMAHENGFENVKIFKDLNGFDRILKITR